MKNEISTIVERRKIILFGWMGTKNFSITIKLNIYFSLAHVNISAEKTSANVRFNEEIKEKSGE